VREQGKSRRRLLSFQVVEQGGNSRCCAIAYGALHSLICYPEMAPPSQQKFRQLAICLAPTLRLYLEFPGQMHDVSRR
jgi:hypothetical protein